MAEISIIDKAMDIGGGILRLVPSWVPRSFCRPGKRIKFILTTTMCLVLTGEG